MGVGAIGERELAEAETRAKRTVAALGESLAAARIEAPPALARAAQARENLTTAIDREFGLLTSAEAGAAMGSRSSAKRNLAAAARKAGRLLGLPRGGYVVFPGFQFDEHGVRPVIAKLIELGAQYDRTESGLIWWLMASTTYLDGRRPVDVIDDEESLLRVAEAAFGVEW